MSNELEMLLFITGLIGAVYAFFQRESAIIKLIEEVNEKIDRRLDSLDQHDIRLEGKINIIEATLKEFKAGLENRFLTMHERQNRHSVKIDEIKDELRNKLDFHFRDDLNDSHL